MDILPLKSNFSEHIDNALIVDFLTTSASVFNKHSYLSLKDNDNLRVALSSIQSREDERVLPLLQTLIKQDTEYLYVLFSRYGSNRLGSNVFRYTLRPGLHRLIQNLSEWGDQLIPLAKRCFNRGFVLYSGTDTEMRCLYSSILLQLAQTIDDCCQKLWNLDKVCSSYFPHSMSAGEEAEYTLDEQICEALGFSKLCFDPFPHLSNKKIGYSIADCIEPILDAALEISWQMSQKSPLENEPPLTVLCEWAYSECQKLRQEPLTRSSHLLSWDIRRIIFLNALGCIQTSIGKLQKAFYDLVSEHQKDTFAGGAAFKPGKDVERRITSDLIAEGSPAKTANSAAAELFSYMEKNTIEPSELLEAELGKINHILTPKSLKLLKDFCSSQDHIKVAIGEKKKTLERANCLSERFKNYLNQLEQIGIIILVLVLVAACGIKSAPKSDIIDYRPQTPNEELNFKSYEDPGKPLQSPLEKVKEPRHSRPDVSSDNQIRQSYDNNRTNSQSKESP
ncbi:MAG: hypothetical protein AB8G05_04570 [Oligoflexales bacterium]